MSNPTEGEDTPEGPLETRREGLEEKDFSPNSLCRSWFFEPGDDGRVGFIVAEPQAGTYLVEVYEIIPVELHDFMVGPDLRQELVKLENMTSWKFFDTNTRMRLAYQNHRKEIEA